MLRKFIKWVFKKQFEKEVESIESRLQKASLLIEQANESKITAQRRNFTVLEKCEIDSEHYLRTMKDIYENNSFQYEIFIVKTMIEAMIVDGKQESALLGQGMLKGIDLLKTKLQTATLKYYQIQEEKNAKIQNQGTQEETY